MQHSMEHDMFQYAADRCRFTTSRVGLLSPFGYSRRWPLGKAGAADSLRWTSCAPRLHTKGFFSQYYANFLWIEKSKPYTTNELDALRAPSRQTKQFALEEMSEPQQTS